MGSGAPIGAGVLPDGSAAPIAALSSRMQEREPTTQQAHKDRGTRDKGTRKEREERAEASPQKKGIPPPHMARSRQPFPSSQIRVKKSAKSRLGGYEKIFGKIFRWNVSGKRKTPRVISTEGAFDKSYK